MNQYVLHHHLAKLKGYEIGVFDGKSYLLAIPFAEYKFYNSQDDGQLIKIATHQTTPDSGYFDFEKHESIIELPDEWEYLQCGTSNMVNKNEFRIKPLLVGYNDIIQASNNMLTLNTYKTFGRDYILNMVDLLCSLEMYSKFNFQFRKHRNHSYDSVNYGYLIVYCENNPNTKVCVDTHGYADGHIAIENFEAFERLKKKLLKLKEMLNE